MKRKIFTFLLSLIILILSASAIMNNKDLVGVALAWDDCPKGLVNDEYPGSCPKYVDTDGNGICDHSEPAPEDRTQDQDLNEVTTEKPVENPIVLPGSNETKNTLNKGLASFISIFTPLTVIVGYSVVYKVKQNNKS